jgi:uncharacterized membrane protein YhaH (DUF805 family)
VSFGDAIKTCFSKYSDFSGRATRSEFWWFALFVWLVQLIPYLLLMTAMPASGEDPSGAFWLWIVLLVVIFLGLFLPYLGVLVRRLHDTDKSGWWYWIVLVPCIGPIWLLILLVSPSTQGQNKFG